MSETVYIETSILGYLTARSTRNLIFAANIEVTKEWWESRRNGFILYVSQVVLDEMLRGDPEIAANRLDILNGVPLVELNQHLEFCQFVVKVLQNVVSDCKMIGKGDIISTSIIDQVIEQLRSMPQPLQRQVIKFARTLFSAQIQGVPSQQLLQFAGAIPLDDLQLMQKAIEQDCEQVDLNEW